MNPLASGAFFILEARVKCLDRVCVVSPFMGMGGNTGLGRSPGAWPKAVLASPSNPDKTTKAIAGNRDLFFLFIEDFIYSDICFLKRQGSSSTGCLYHLNKCINYTNKTLT